MMVLILGQAKQQQKQQQTFMQVGVGSNCVDMRRQKACTFLSFCQVYFLCVPFVPQRGRVKIPSNLSDDHARSTHLDTKPSSHRLLAIGPVWRVKTFLVTWFEGEQVELRLISKLLISWTTKGLVEMAAKETGD